MIKYFNYFNFFDFYFFFFFVSIVPAVRVLDLKGFKVRLRLFHFSNLRSSKLGRKDVESGTNREKVGTNSYALGANIALLEFHSRFSNHDTLKLGRNQPIRSISAIGNAFLAQFIVT